MSSGPTAAWYPTGRRRWTSRASTTGRSSPIPSADYAIVGKNGDDREYDYETNTETKNYTYTGRGGVPIGDWLSRSVFAAKFAERNFLFSNVIGSNSKILFNRDPAQRVEAVAPWLTTDSSMYPAIVNKRLVWIIDGYTTLDNYPYSELTSL